MAGKIHAIFDSHTEALAALDELERKGVPRSSITLLSSEPVHAESSEEKTRIGLFAIAGGLAGAAVAVALTVLTSRSVDLVTGGMPIVSPWPFGIIVFELTMLGAILGTLGRMMYEARLLRRNSTADYGEAIADGRVVLAVDCADDSHAEVVETLPGFSRKSDTGSGQDSNGERAK